MFSLRSSTTPTHSRREEFLVPYIFLNLKAGNNLLRLVLIDFNPKASRSNPSLIGEFDKYRDQLNLVPRPRDDFIYPNVT